MLGTHRKMKRQGDGANHQCDLALGTRHFPVKTTPCTYLLWKKMFEKAVLPQEIANGHIIVFLFMSEGCRLGRNSALFKYWEGGR